MEFSGLPHGYYSTPVPDPFLGPLLQEIDDLTELKVTLRGIWLWQQKRSLPRILSREEFFSDSVLRRGLDVGRRSPISEIEKGLEAAVARGTFLLYQQDRRDAASRFYLLNDESGRRALTKLKQGSVPLPNDPGDRQDEGLFDDPAASKANIFTLYELNIGKTIGPMLAEELKDAEEQYPWPWIVEATQIAVVSNALEWRYISSILRRWASEGKDNGKLGRYSQKDSRKGYLEEYQRRRGHLPGGRAGG